MSYTALYRRFRPATFDEVKGQDAIVKTLKNQIKADRLGHAYLFCGTRGTGKTSVAKIFAKAVNCEHPVDGSPCGECPSCRAIAEGSAMNVIEIDAASNNGVDNIRTIREEIAYPPTDGRYKVYIIDEAHMLSPSAFNALLKTLEEPPAYVIFILATTDIHPIPATILSRCQRYDFRRLGQETILEQLTDLCGREQVEAEEKALRYIARKADGSMRDALSLLDQCISFYLGETLTYDRVLEVLGAVDTDVFSDLLRKLLQGQLAEAIRTLEQLLLKGYDLTQFVNDFTWYMRNLMLIQASDDMEDVLDVSTENLAQLKEEAAMVDSDTLMRYIRIFSELSGTIRHESNKRVAVEMAMIRLTRPEMEHDDQSLAERIRRLEKMAEEGAFSAAPAQTVSCTAPQKDAANPAPQGDGTDAPSQPAAADTAEPEADKKPQKQEPPAKPAPEDLQKVCEMWPQIIRNTDRILRNIISESEPGYNTEDEKDTTLYVVLRGSLSSLYKNDEEKKTELEQVIADTIGKRIEVKFLSAEEESVKKNRIAAISLDEKLHELVHMDIEEED